MIHTIPKLLAAKLLLYLATRLKTSRESRQVLHTAGGERLRRTFNLPGDKCAY